MLIHRIRSSNRGRRAYARAISSIGAAPLIWDKNKLRRRLRHTRVHAAMIFANAAKGKSLWGPKFLKSLMLFFLWLYARQPGKVLNALNA